MLHAEAHGISIDILLEANKRKWIPTKYLVRFIIVIFELAQKDKLFTITVSTFN